MALETDFLYPEEQFTESTNESEYNITPEYYPTWKQPLHMIIIYSIVYSIVFFLGVIGNTLVILVVYGNKQMRNVTNYYIVNMAVADILVGVFVLPITLMSNLLMGWRFGSVMCKLTPYLQGVAVFASGSSLSAIAVDRYLAICHGMSFHVTRKGARMVITGIWILALSIMTPWAVFYRQDDQSTSIQTIYVCNQFWPSDELKKGYFLGVIFLTCYTLPLIFITCFYALVCHRVWFRNAPGASLSNNGVIYRSKVNVLKMLIVVVILFACAWLPLYAVNMRIYFGDPIENIMELDIIYKIVIPIAQWLGASNSCVNPIVYCVFSKKFRAGMTRILSCGGLVVRGGEMESFSMSLSMPHNERSLSSGRLSTFGTATKYQPYGRDNGFSRFNGSHRESTAEADKIRFHHRLHKLSSNTSSSVISMKSNSLQ